MLISTVSPISALRALTSSHVVVEMNVGDVVDGIVVCAFVTGLLVISIVW